MPPTFKPDIQRILLKKKIKDSKEGIYGTITLYGSKIPNRIQQPSTKAQKHLILYTTSPLISLQGIQFVLRRFRSPLLTTSHIAFFSSTY